SSFNQQQGTIAKEETASMEDVVIRGVSIDRKQAKLTVNDAPDRPRIAGRIFSTIAHANINVDMIVQNIAANGTTDVSFTINEADLNQTRALLEPIVVELGASLVTQSDVSKLSVVGIGMRSHSG